MFDILEDKTLCACLDFIVKVDALKKVLRKTSVIKNARLENTAEHSWHLTLMAMVLNRYANEPIKLDRVIKMLVLHDLGEIEFGDTFFYDVARAQAQDNERSVITKLFESLPEELRQEFMELWEEFTIGTTSEANFARAMDRFEPFLSNLANDGGSWVSMKITKEKALTKNQHIDEGSHRLWDAYQKLAQQADDKKYFYQN
jgi:putative hydrolase of HD superfamily